MAAAVGSLMMRKTFIPEMVPASYQRIRETTQVTDLKRSAHSNNGKQIDPEGIFRKRYAFIVYHQLSLHSSIDSSLIVRPFFHDILHDLQQSFSLDQHTSTFC